MGLKRLLVCLVQGGEVVQLDVDLKVSCSTPGLDKLEFESQLTRPIYWGYVQVLSESNPGNLANGKRFLRDESIVYNSLYTTYNRSAALSVEKVY